AGGRPGDGGGSRPGGGGAAVVTRRRRWIELVGLVARREMQERSRARSYRLTTVILILTVAAAVVIPALLKGHHAVERVGVVGAAPAAQSAADQSAAAQSAAAQTVREAGRVTGSSVAVVPVASLDRARAELRSGSLAVVLVSGKEVLVKQSPGQGSTSSTASLAGAISQLAGLQAVFAQLPPGVAGSLSSHGLALPVRGLTPPPRKLTSRFTGLYAAIVIYVLILFYGIRITVGVGEEKSSRVVEVLLATLRPVQLLTGKVLGMGLVAVAQVAAMVVTALILGAAVGSTLLHGTSAGVLGIGAMWFVLGYAFYCTAFAAAGSLINRQADTYNATLPIQIPLILAYILSFSVAFGSVSPLDRVLGFLPPTAPVMMTMLYAAGAAPAWQVAASAVICVAATIGMAKVAALVYERAILRTGRRVRVREVLRTRTT
ncbi:MAG: ABC transporter permease, partial [Acidimicrobiales bacterium]